MVGKHGAVLAPLAITAHSTVGYRSVDVPALLPWRGHRVAAAEYDGVKKSIHQIIHATFATCLVTTAWAQDAAPTKLAPTAESGWAAMSKCAAIADDDTRHACSDKVLREAGLLSAVDTALAERRRKGFGLEKPMSPAAAPPSAPDAPTRPAIEDHLEVTLATVTDSVDGKLTLTTTEGAIWKQVESEAVRPTPRAGQTMKIEKAALGGFMCRPTKYVAFRCFRTR